MQCVVFTDSCCLANKYNTSVESVKKLIQHNLLLNKNTEFLLLDASDYTEELGQESNWRGYKSILLDFFAGMGLVHSPELSVFIIGGDDVIPMPRIESPINPDEPIHADLLYCFPCMDIPDSFDVTKAICNIGRLPMENGRMTHSIKDDLQSYFNLVSMFIDHGIEIDSVVMTSTESWLPASGDMIRNLPVNKPQHINGVTVDDMYVSPELSAVDVNHRIVRQYIRDIQDADMLMFNLHGSNAPNYASFYGEGSTGHNTPEAFSMKMIPYMGARIFNTVACFGGRFIGYNRNQSMLLSSLYGGGVLLYAGSCVSALGRSGTIHQQAHDILIPSGMSESFMKLYARYLISGLPAGVAFLKAKFDYFNTCRKIDGDECALATVLMFNLFGLPVLHSTGNEGRQCKIKNAARPYLIPKNPPLYTTKYHKATGTTGMLSQVQSLVDKNIAEIKEKVSSSLYAYWGLNPNCLRKIEKCEGRTSRSYRFEYFEENTVFSRKIWAYTDSRGNVCDVIHFK